MAVKVFRLDITPEQARTLADELSRAAEAGLFHPSIVEPLAAGVEGTVAYRAEEYVAAESLDVAMRHYAPATPDKVLPFITQLAGAIDFARAAGVGHGALHPRDIFVTPDEARATGFGVVDALERVGLRAPVRRPYSAPERIAGNAWSTPADVFSLAAIAFELLTARRPSGTGDQIGSLAGVPAQRAEHLHGVLARAMHEDPSARYPTALAFVAALEGGASEAPAASVSALGVPAISVPPSREGAPPAVSVPPSVPVVREAASPPSPVRDPAPPATPDVRGAAAPPAVSSPVPPVTETKPAEADDVAAEREEDEAHWELFKEEQSEPEGIETEESRMLFSDEEAEKAADELMVDAADLTLRSDAGRHAGSVDEPSVGNFADESAAAALRISTPEYERPAVAHAQTRVAAPPPIVAPQPTTPPRAIVPPVFGKPPHLPSEDDDLPLVDDLRREAVVQESARTPSMLPLTLTLLVGLLLGFLSAYAVLSRSPAPETVTTENPRRAAGESGAAPTGSTGAQAGSTDAPAGREYSEGAVTPPPRPRSTPPDVPAESATNPPSKPATPTPAAADKPPPARPQPRNGRIVVRSTPTGASVTVNGTWRGRTPLTLEELAFGDYAVRIVQPGYEVARETVRLSASQAARTVSHRLVRTPGAARGGAPRGSAARPSAAAGGAAESTFKGSIFVDSRPRGAKVFIDGKELGTTPLRVPELAIGAHVVRLELPDHRTWTNGIRIAAGEEVRVTGSLEPVR